MDQVINVLPTGVELGFGKFYAPLMIEANYANGAWGAFELKKLMPLALHPGSRVLHYAQEIFEGLKVYKQSEKEFILFRPEENIKRMTKSAEMMAMPPFDEGEFLNAMLVLVHELKHLVPSEPGSLYLRPTMIGVSEALGVAPATEYKFYILASPTGGYFGGLEKGIPATINVHVTAEHVRAVRGGVGAAKTGANYAASLLAVTKAKKMGYSNVLFLDAILQKNIEELSGMNIFIYADGVLRTPILGDTILDGVTRKSILTLAKKAGIKTLEEDISIDTLYHYAGKTNSDLEVFACGTGASVAAISELNYKNKKITIAGAKPGIITTKLYNDLLDLQFGRNQKDFKEWRVLI